MLSDSNCQKTLLPESKSSLENCKANVLVLDHADARKLQEAVRVKHKKAFDVLKDK